MAELKIKIPDELEESIKEFKLDWSAVATKAILDKAEKLKKLKRFSSKVKVSDEDAKAITDKISETVAERFKGK